MLFNKEKKIKNKKKKKKKKTTYANVFKSTGIGFLNFIHSRPVPALLKALA